MLFNSETYLFFLGLVVLTNWSLPSRWRVAFLVLASYVFYAYWSVPFLFLVVAMTAANYGFGLLQDGRRSRQLLATIVVLNLGVLGLFKYLGFLESSALRVAAVLGLPSSVPLVNLILPLGLSFFTFEFLHYQVDLYRGGQPVRDPLHFALFPAFFPTQIAGPIKRYQDFEAQVLTQPRWDPGLFLEGIELIALGLFKKVVLADSLLPVANAVFSHTSTVTALEGWTGLLAFSFQIYLDFSGYTDVARGSAQLLGYRVPSNFRAPYLATSIRDFWHRWHISLSSWLRDYLYIPLGGSQKGRRRTFVNLLLTMALGGLWHGAAWHFVAWGAGHGAALAADRAYSERAPQTAAVSWSGAVGGWTLTQGAVLGLWTLFRAPGLASAVQLWRGLIAGGVGHPLFTSTTILQVLGTCMLVLAVEFIAVRVDVYDWLRTRTVGVALRPAMVVSLAAASTFVATIQVTHRFIYFQF